MKSLWSNVKPVILFEIDQCAGACQRLSWCLSASPSRGIQRNPRDCTLPVLVGEVALEWPISITPEASRLLALEERRLAPSDNLVKQLLHHDNFSCDSRTRCAHSRWSTCVVRCAHTESCSAICIAVSCAFILFKDVLAS
jgi:hypothetical protein